MDDVTYNEGYTAYPKEDCPYDLNTDQSRNISWWKGWDDAERKDIPSALERIENANIFSIGKDEYGFLLEECCDNYYTKHITKEDLLQLAQEIIDIANS